MPIHIMSYVHERRLSKKALATVLETSECIILPAACIAQLVRALGQKAKVI